MKHLLRRRWGPRVAAFALATLVLSGGCKFGDGPMTLQVGTHVYFVQCSHVDPELVGDSRLDSGYWTTSGITEAAPVQGVSQDEAAAVRGDACDGKGWNLAVERDVPESRLATLIKSVAPKRDRPNESALRTGPITDPCAQLGNETTLDSLEHGKLPFGFYMSSDPLADEAALTAAYSCDKANDSVELHFSSGIQIDMNQNSIRDPGKAWRGLAKQDPQDTSVGDVQGEPAAFIDPAKSTGGALGSVTVVLGNTWMCIVGNGRLSIEDLQRVADAERLVSPSGH